MFIFRSIYLSIYLGHHFKIPFLYLVQGHADSKKIDYDINSNNSKNSSASNSSASDSIDSRGDSNLDRALRKGMKVRIVMKLQNTTYPLLTKLFL